MNVLIGVDDSPESNDAVRTAFEFFGPRAAFTIASVGRRNTSSYGPIFATGYPVGGFLTADELTTQFDTARSAAEATALAAKDQLAPLDVDVDVDVDVELGHVGVELCRLAEEHRSEVIVIGSHDKNVWQRLFDPSVGRYLIDHAPCPVLVVR